MPPSLSGRQADDRQRYTQPGAQASGARAPMRQGHQKRAEAQAHHQRVERAAQANVGHESETGQQHPGDRAHRVPGKQAPDSVAERFGLSAQRANPKRQHRAEQAPGHAEHHH